MARTTKMTPKFYTPEFSFLKFLVSYNLNMLLLVGEKWGKKSLNNMNVLQYKISNLRFVKPVKLPWGFSAVVLSVGKQLNFPAFVTATLY